MRKKAEIRKEVEDLIKDRATMFIRKYELTESNFRNAIFTQDTMIDCLFWTLGFDNGYWLCMNELDKNNYKF